MRFGFENQSENKLEVKLAKFDSKSWTEKLDQKVEPKRWIRKLDQKVAPES